MIETAASWVLAEGCGYRREPARPVHLRPGNFAELFDAQTVFYDCFRISPSQVMLIGPPLVRFAGVLPSLKIMVIPSGDQCRYRVEHKLTTGVCNRQTHNICRILVEAAEGVRSLHLQCEAGETTMPVAPGSAAHFQGKRVLLTQSRDNDPVWICDWMRFHRDLHQADAVLLYDNGSTAYTPQQLLAAMQQVSGFTALTVVAWPYKFGPQGLGRGTWDSAFCQDGALEDARWRFLQEAQAVLSCDIDELVLAQQSVFDLAARSRHGYARFSGRWVKPSVDAANGALPRHRDSTLQLLPRWQWKTYRLRDTHLSPPKWAVQPARCPESAHWSVHEVVGMKRRTEKLTAACYRHFQRITTNWKKSRMNSDAASVPSFGKDLELIKAFEKVRWSE